MLSNGTAGVAVAVDCDERTRLLSDEIVVVTAAAASAAPSSSVGVAAPVPPTSLPLVHTTATTTPAAAAATNNNVNNNNNAMVVVSAKNTVNNANTHTNTNTNKSKSNNNNAAAATATAATGATETAEATADDEDLSSDLSDKFPRPQKKPGKLSKLGTKSVGLKRVSFGSSKGSMVETLVFETPTPLSEHVESTFGFDAAAGDAGDHPGAAVAAAAGQLPLASTLASHLPHVGGGYSGDYAKGNMDDSGIEVQEESERSIVRVSIYESSQPQQPDYLPDDSLAGDGYPYNTNDLDLYPTMAATAATGMMQQQTLGLGAAYDRQQSTDSGWDNPFRPGGDLSREADEIVSMIRGGQPITPTEDRTIGNGSTAQHADDNCNGGGVAIGESVTKTNLSQNLATAQNGTNSHASATADAGAGKAGKASDQLTAGGGGGGGNNNGVTSLGQVSKQVVPGPISASHVVIDEKKSKKKGCCVLQ
ncbi:hypothetical protein KR038_011327 [Drosophila bunnanda]|nr:hypothetical protein KR038_011327 [Drosophila bunnanda]